MQHQPTLTELEQTKLALVQARRATFAAQKLAIQLAERDNEEEAAALEQGIFARLEAEKKAAEEAEAAKRAAELPPAPTGDAAVVELRPEGTVEVPAAA